MNAPLPVVSMPLPSAGPDTGSALDGLMRRMREFSEFPAMSAAIIAINRVAGDEHSNTATLASAILKDFALTKKILWLVNTVHYGQFSTPRISTISRAIVILGVETIRSMTISLMLFDHIRDRKQADGLAQEFLRASFAALLARELCPATVHGNAEEAYICALFRGLGRVLATCWFNDESLAIRALAARERLDEEIAANRVLGVSYREFGIAVAKSWGFPSSIIHSMQRVASGKVAPSVHPDDGLRALSALSSELVHLIERSAAGGERKTAIDQLCARFHDSFALTPRQVEAAADSAGKQLLEMSSIYKLDVAATPLGPRLLPNSSAAPSAAHPVNAPAVPTSPNEALIPADPATPDAEATSDCESLLTVGIQDVSNALIEDCPLSDVLRIVTETIFRALPVRRVILCLRDGRTQRMVGRLALGTDLGQTQNEIQSHFQFPLPAAGDAAPSTNLFNVILAQDIDVLISDASEAKVRKRLPDWYLEHFSAPSFLVMPMRLKQAPIAMIYADCDQPGGLTISAKEFALLRSLRNQAVLAIKQQR